MVRRLALNLLPGGLIDLGFLRQHLFENARRFLSDRVAVFKKVHIFQGGQRIGHRVGELVHLLAADSFGLVALDPHSTALYLRTSSFLIFLNISW